MERQQIEQTETLRQMEHDLKAVKEQNTHMLEQIQLNNSQNKLTHEKLDTIAHHLQLRKPALSASSSASSAAPITIDRWCQDAARQTQSDLSNIPFPVELIDSAKDVSMSSLYFRWFDEKFYERKPDTASILHEFQSRTGATPV